MWRLTIALIAIALPLGAQQPMDLVSELIDNNGLLINPHWRAQEANRQTLPDPAVLCNGFHNEDDARLFNNCSSQSPTVDEPSALQPVMYATCQAEHPTGTVHGHINWFPVTYYGHLYFLDWQTPISVNDNGVGLGDDDYDLVLVRSDRSGVTIGNHNRSTSGDIGIDVEFNAAETVDTFTAPWWTGLRARVEAHPGSWESARQIVDGKLAIITALYGIDNQHQAHAELHPVYLLAILDRDDAREQVWEFFARNWGNEGGCSQDDHHLLLPDNVVSVFFQNPSEDEKLVGIDETTTELHSRPAGATAWRAITTPHGVVVSFKLLRPQDHSIIHGELHLQKTGRSRRPSMMTARIPAPAGRPRLAREPETTKEWDVLISRLDSSQRQLFARAMTDELQGSRMQTAADREQKLHAALLATLGSEQGVQQFLKVLATLHH